MLIFYPKNTCIHEICFVSLQCQIKRLHDILVIQRSKATKDLVKR